MAAGHLDPATAAALNALIDSVEVALGNARAVIALMTSGSHDTSEPGSPFEGPPDSPTASGSPSDLFGPAPWKPGSEAQRVMDPFGQYPL